MAPSIDAKAVALIAAGSAAVTYLIAKRQFESKIVTERRKVRANKIWASVRIPSFSLEFILNQFVMNPYYNFT